jgi:hypothetical protein
MTTVTGVQGRSTTLAAIKAENHKNDSEASEQSASGVVVTGVRQVSADTSVTTVVLSTADSTLPNLSLDDVLIQSGVDENAEVVLETVGDGSFVEQNGKDNLSGANSESAPLEGEQLLDAIEAIESADSIVVEVVETADNVQTVTVRAADIDTLYTQATVPLPGASTSGTSNFLLLKNGWAYTNLQSSPLQLPVEPADQSPGDGWVMWRSVEEGVHEIQDAATGIWSRIVGLVVDTSPKSAEDVAGVFKANSFDTQILYTSTTQTTLQLSDQGIFTNTQSSLTTSTTAITDITYALNSRVSPGGRSTSFTGAGQSGGSNTVAIGSSQQMTDIAGNMFGAYRILEDGVTLELRYADGTVDQKLFLKTLGGGLTIDGDQYARSGDVSVDMLDQLMDLLLNSGDSSFRSEWLKAVAEAMRKSAKSLPQNNTQDRSQQ